MKTFSRHMGITLPITTEFRRVADRFAEQCPIQEKAEQIRRNTLAVCAVNAYLELMEIPTRLEEGDSWSPMMQMMSDVADLKVPGLGRLSCRALLPEDEACYVPPEAWEDRAGYVAVVLDELNHQATLLGFTKAVEEQEQVALSQFTPIESLIDCVHGLQSVAETAAIAPSPTQSVTPSATPSMAQSMTAAPTRITQLGQWFQAEAEALAEAGWLAVEQLISPTQADFAFRLAKLPSVSHAKRVSLDMGAGQSVQVALVIKLKQGVPVMTSQDSPAQVDSPGNQPTNILVQVHPIGAASVLPEGVVLNVLDERGEVASSATSRAADNYIQLQFSGDVEEQFIVQVLLSEASFEEQFEI